MGISQLPSGRYRLQIRRQGLKVDETFVTETEARDASQRYTQGKSRGAADLPLDGAWMLYEQSLAFLRKRENTRNTEFSRIKNVLRQLGRRPLRNITSDDVEQYIIGRIKEDPPPSPDSVRLEVAALSALMNFCRKKSLVSANPCIGVQRPAPIHTLKRLHPEDEGQLISLLAHDNPRFRFAARLCLLVRETGARPGEWLKAGFNDVDLEKRTVLFRETKYKGMPRSVPLTMAAERLLVAQMEDVYITNLERFGPTDYLFPAVAKDGSVGPMQYSAAIRDLKKKNLLNRRVKAHTGRHEFISSLVESTDLDDSRIMSLVGHHSHASMEIYKHVRNIRFRPQIEEIEPGRRQQRLRAIAKALNIPPRLVEVLLLKEREHQAAEGIPDEGEELLFGSEFVEKVAELANRLGTTPRSKLEGMARLKALREAAQTAGGSGNRGDDLQQCMESVSVKERLHPSDKDDKAS